MFDPFDKKEIFYEEINFDSLSVIKVAKDRQVFYDEKDKLFYKIFVDGWEFADKVEEGIDSGYYDLILVPNWYGLIKNKKGMNKGYITHMFDEEKTLLANYVGKMPKITKIKRIIKGEIGLKEILFPYFKPRIEDLILLLQLTFSRAIISNSIWCELNPLHIWVDQTGYHIFDLDAYRNLDWLFCKDKSDPEYIRKVVNRKDLNGGLKELIIFHGLKFPFEIDEVKKIQLFWDEFLFLNSLDNSLEL